MAVAKPPKLPIWDENATNIVEPQSTNQSDGWQVDANGIPQKPPFQYHNYMWHTQYKWFEYLDAEKALLQGDSTKTFKVADAVNENEALSKGQLLAAIKEVDGAGSGIDAELLDGKQSSEYAIVAGTLGQFADSTDGSNTVSTNGRDFDINGKRALVGCSTADGDVLYINYDSDFAKGVKISGVVQINGYTDWHAGNDGKDSGLDADLVRGLPADFTSSKATNGYQKLPSGLIVQWGTTGATDIPDGGSLTITFPIAFPTSCVNVTVSSNSRISFNVSTGASGAKTAYTTTSFTVYGESGSANGCDWLAIGY